MDNIDTANGISDFVPMQDLFNEWHAKNTSQKVKNVFHNKGMSRIPFTSNLPYSHKKDPKMPRFMSANKRGHSESFWKHADSASMFALRNFPQSAMTLQPTPCQYESDKSLEQQHSETDISSRTSTVCNSLSCPTLHAYKYFEDKSIWKKASAYAIMPLGKKDAKNAM